MNIVKFSNLREKKKGVQFGESVGVNRGLEGTRSKELNGPIIQTFKFIISLVEMIMLGFIHCFIIEIGECFVIMDSLAPKSH